MHGCSKHLDGRFHSLRDIVRDRLVELTQCSIQEQVADVLTKPLKQSPFGIVVDCFSKYFLFRNTSK
jgi:hypothetical protein